MLLVVLGAGASHDFVMSRSSQVTGDFRPPLTDGLVADTNGNRSVLAQIPRFAASGLVADHASSEAKRWSGCSTTS